MVNQFVHLLEPRLCILVLEIITHCPHNMVIPGDICLQIMTWLLPVIACLNICVQTIRATDEEILLGLKQRQ